MSGLHCSKLTKKRRNCNSRKQLLRGLPWNYLFFNFKNITRDILSSKILVKNLTSIYIPAFPPPILFIPTLISHIPLVSNIPTPIPRIPTLVSCIPTPIPHISTLIPRIPTLISRICTLITRIPYILNIPNPIPHIPTLISHIPTLIPSVSTLIPRVPIIPLIPFHDSPFRLLQIAVARYNSFFDCS